MVFGSDRLSVSTAAAIADIDLEGNDLTDSTQDTVDTDKNIRVTDSSELSYGRDNGTLGTGSQAIGIGARAEPDFTTATGKDAARNSTSGNTTATGKDAAKNDGGARIVATGNVAAQFNTGDNCTAVGVAALRSNTGGNTTGLGSNAARGNPGNNTTVAGHNAARGDGLADPTTMGDDNIGIGVSAIRNNQASGLIGIGQEAGINAQQDDQLIITDRNGNRRMVMDLTNGDLSIEGSLSQNANL